MRLRLTKIDEFQFLTCFKYQMWGSKSARFKDWKRNDYLAFIVDKRIAGLAQIVGDSFYSRDPIWDNGLFPHRIPIKFIVVFLKENRPPILGPIRDVLTSLWGPSYGWGILNQKPIGEAETATIINILKSRGNDIEKIKVNIEQLMVEARIQRENLSKPKKLKKERTKNLTNELITIMKTEEIPQSDEDSLHSKAQYFLSQLGKITGCQVFIATNDKNRTYQGLNIGDGCLKTLPNLGLNEEAQRRISLIDVIWIRQGVPVCAFEIETTTSIYSGLLRMSDLLAVVPSIRISLFIVAPKGRQEKTISEILRPTFRKIGLDDYCRFISIEELDKLLSQSLGMDGHLLPTIIEKIAVDSKEGG